MMDWNRFGEPGRGERGLAVLLVDVELAALGAGACRRFRLVDRRRDAAKVEDPREDKAAQARADDRHGDHDRFRLV